MFLVSESSIIWKCQGKGRYYDKSNTMFFPVSAHGRSNRTPTWLLTLDVICIHYPECALAQDTNFTAYLLRVYLVDDTCGSVSLWAYILLVLMTDCGRSTYSHITNIRCFIAVVSRGQSSLSKHTHHPSWYKIGFTRRQGDTWEAEREASSPDHIPSGIQPWEAVCVLYVACIWDIVILCIHLYWSYSLLVSIHPRWESKNISLEAEPPCLLYVVVVDLWPRAGCVGIINLLCLGKDLRVCHVLIKPYQWGAQMESENY